MIKPIIYASIYYEVLTGSACRLVWFIKNNNIDFMPKQSFCQIVTKVNILGFNNNYLNSLLRKWEV